ncbi:DUF533 domain-containing protein [uncultured Xylophilus sp.]|uniref:YcjF family protein n=1 Tax=uncultured Xylophilus sp. TaxID=296832 RepID=UPI0025ED8229|nr:DUF533 domain-containing protein [uncultured Xylophilus sp.]
MTEAEQTSILTLSLMAAFADGDKHARERDEVKRIAEGLGSAGSIAVAPLYQDVLMQRTTLPQAAAALTTPASRSLAYEMAVCVCDADGAQSQAEQAFLAQLRQALQLGEREARPIEEQAEALAEAPLSVPPELAATAAAAVPAPAGGAPVARPDDAALDKTILNAAILNGALELLPESLSTMAIIPLQMKLVYGIGKAHGYELDKGHIKDFLATLGVGLTSQYLEQAGRKLLGGLLGKVGGGLLGGLGRQAVSSGMSFASTYALGHVAKRYYAGGRTFSTQMLKDSYQGVLQEAQGLQTRYLPQMQEKARTLDAGSVLQLVRGR